LIHDLPSLSGVSSRHLTSTATGAADRLLARYDREAAGWHRRITRLGYVAAYQALAAEAAALGWFAGNVPLRLLDAGAGTGALALALGTRLPPGSIIELLEPSAAMRRAAIRNLAACGLPVFAIAGTLEALPAAASYDMVGAAHLIEHLPGTDVALRGLRQVLRPGGRLVLVVSRPHWCSRLVQLRWRHRIPDDAEVTEAMRGAGFAEPRLLGFPAGPPWRTSRAYVAIADAPAGAQIRAGDAAVDEAPDPTGADRRAGRGR
jgi:SAM-dependent methyltransferase